MYNLKYNFDKISNHTEAYILGFIYADGFVMGKPFNRFGIMLARRDEELLKDISSYISDEVPLKYDERGEFKSVRLIICRKELIENLNKLGVLPNKTHIDFGLPNIPKEFILSFIRGYFDGDGSIIRDKKALIFYICSPLPRILSDIKEVFDKFQISSRITVDHRRGKYSNLAKNHIANYDQYRLIVTKKVYLQKLYTLLYEHNEIFLKRKELIFKECFNSPQRESRNLEYITYNGETKSMKEWSKQLNVPIATLLHRLYKAKWTIDEVMTFGIYENKKRQKEKVLKGTSHPLSKFSEEEIISIYLSTEGACKLAKFYNVHRDTIRKIRYGINYSSITKNLIKT